MPTRLCNHQYKNVWHIWLNLGTSHLIDFSKPWYPKLFYNSTSQHLHTWQWAANYLETKDFWIRIRKIWLTVLLTKTDNTLEQIQMVFLWQFWYDQGSCFKLVEYEEGDASCHLPWKGEVEPMMPVYWQYNW